MTELPEIATPRLPPIWVLDMTNGTLSLTSEFIVVTLPQILAAQGVPGGHFAAVEHTATS